MAAPPGCHSDLPAALCDKGRASFSLLPVEKVPRGRGVHTRAEGLLSSPLASWGLLLVSSKHPHPTLLAPGPGASRTRRKERSTR